MEAITEIGHEVVPVLDVPGIALFLFLLLSDPMCDMLGLIGDKSGVPKIYVSFVLAPLASNASVPVAAMQLASK